MTIKDEILIIANQLANEGKKPTLALIKPKLSAPTPLPIIISTLKSWQHQPDNVGPINKGEAQKTHLANNDKQNQNIEQQIEQALKPLKQELTDVKAMLKQLLDKA